MADTKRPFSYHTFMFPFLFDNYKIKSFKKKLNSNWKEELYSDKLEQFSDVDYNTIHYFNTAAQSIIYTKSQKSPVVSNYIFDLGAGIDENWLDSKKGIDNKAKYVIEKGDVKHALSINAIRLKLFNTGIGILIFELENYSSGKEKDILWINDFGRRIYMPFCANGKCSICADRVVLKFGDKYLTEDGIIPEKFKKSDDTVFAQPIVYLLGGNGFEPVIDDRMFVACYYKNAELIKHATEWDNGEYRCFSDALNKKTNDKTNVSQLIYQFICVDGDGSTCHDRNMIYKYLKEHIYSRWLENYDESGNISGTLTGITEYSMVTISSNDEDFLTIPFLTQYVEMMLIVLAQRASLLLFERLTFENIGKKHDFINLHKKYNEFQGNLLLNELTSQQQGIELYNMLRANLFVNDRVADIENHIEKLSMQKSADIESKENLILFIIAVLGIIQAADIIFNWLSLNILPLWKILAGILIVAPIIVKYILNRYRG